jgi:hypothetical protein
MDNMIKFYRGLAGKLPEVGVNGALYITTDEGAIYYGTGSGMKRLGDFIQVDAVANLPADGANTSALYYCVAENILAKWNGSSWTQVNKQPTAEELKTLLGLGSLAYKAKVVEGDLDSALAEKVNAAAEGNHAHSNKGVLDGITSDKVTAWDAAEQNAKDYAKSYADGLDGAMDTRVKAVEAAIGENGSVASQIKTAIEALDYTDTAVDGQYVSAVNEVDGKISVTRKALPDYSNTYDAKGAANTAYENAKAYADGLAGNYDVSGAAAGVKSELTAEINKRVEKVEGKSLIADSEITRLAGMSTGANKVEASANNGSIKIDGVETVVYTHPEKHAIADVTGLQDALNGLQAKGDYSEVGHKHVKADITDFAHTHVASEITDLDSTIKSYDYATKTELGNVDKKFENYKTAEAQKAIDDEQDRRLGVLEGASATHATKDELAGVDAKFADYTKTADLPTDLGDFTNNAGYAKTADVNAELAKKADATQVATDIANAIAPLATTEALNGVKATADAAAVKTEVEAALALKADKSVVDAMYTNEQIDAAILVETNRAKGVEESLQTQINTIMNNPDTEGVINSINEFTQYIANHGEIAEGFRTDIDKNKEDISANAQAIADEIARAAYQDEYLHGRIDSLIARHEEHTHSWNDLTDKPFEKLTYEIAFERTDDVFDNGVWDSSGTFIKVSNDVFSADDLEDSEFTYIGTYGNRISDTIVDAAYFVDENGVLEYSEIILIIPSVDAAVASGYGNIPAGTYFRCRSDSYVCALNVKTGIKTIDEKFIPATIARATAVEEVSDRVATLEAIDHDAYVAADDVLKSEIQGEIAALKTEVGNQDAVVLAEAQAYADQAKADAIVAAEGKVNALAATVYTKEEVDAAVEAAVTAATQWGEF